MEYTTDRHYTPSSEVQKDIYNPCHPRFIAGYKTGAYYARKRIELLPEEAPLVEVGQVKCPGCNTKFSALLCESIPKHTKPLSDKELQDRIIKQLGIGIDKVENKGKLYE